MIEVPDHREKDDSVNSRRKVGFVRLSFRIVDISTAENIQVKTLERKAEVSDATSAGLEEAGIRFDPLEIPTNTDEQFRPHRRNRTRRVLLAGIDDASFGSPDIVACFNNHGDRLPAVAIRFDLRRWGLIRSHSDPKSVETNPETSLKERSLERA